MAEHPPHGPAWLVQAAQIARRFYLDGRSKVEIADELGLSRFKVARIIEEARSLGLVEVTIRLPARIDPGLSGALADALGLRRAVVVAQPGDDAPTVRRELGRVAADLLTELVGPDDVLGMSCSRTIAATTAQLRALAPCRVVQMTGTLAGPDIEAGSVESVRRAAVVGGGKAYPIYAPMVLPDAATVRSLARDTAIRRALDQIADVTIAMVAIGVWQQGLSTVWDAVSREERAAAARTGAVGEISGRLFDAHGREVRTPVDDRVLAMTLEQLRRIPEVIGLAYQRGRAPAVRAAVRGGVIDTLVCDADLAHAVLAEQPAATDEETA